MPWQARSVVSQREEFVALAAAGSNVTLLCERFGISRETGHLWMRRYAAGGVAALQDRSRRPVTSPGKTSGEMEQAILTLRERHPAWGGRKLKARLEQSGFGDVPAASTITAVLRRNGKIAPAASEAARPWTRFEHAQPNDLWQMDFKGPIRTHGGACHALTVLDDHSRFSAGVCACRDQRTSTVREHLESIFERYGLPWRMLADNGSPWSGENGSGWTELKVWLLKLGIVMVHGRPYHPQTQGKDERFHRTLKAELLSRCDFKHVAHAQALMDPWRDVYNLERPHEAIGMVPPATRYRPSTRAMPTRLATYEPGPDQMAVRVREGGYLRYQKNRWYIGVSWDQEVMGLRATSTPGVTEVYFGPYLIAQLDAGAGAVRRVRVVPVSRCARDLHNPHDD